MVSRLSYWHEIIKSLISYNLREKSTHQYPFSLSHFHKLKQNHDANKYTSNKIMSKSCDLKPCEREEQ